MQRYAFTSGFMDLGTDALNSVIWCLANPLASGKFILLKKLHTDMNFSGVAAAARVSFGFGRAVTNTLGGGTRNATGATVGRRNPSAVDPVAVVYVGPAVITGPVPDAIGDMITTGMTEQLTYSMGRDLISIEDNVQGDTIDPDGNWLIVPGTCFYLINRQISIAGVGLSVDAEWAEKSQTQA